MYVYYIIMSLCILINYLQANYKMNSTKLSTSNTVLLPTEFPVRVGLPGGVVALSPSVSS